MKKTNNVIIILIIIITLIGTFSISSMAQSYKVIVNSSNSVSSLTKGQVSKLFLKKTKKWDNSADVMPVDQSVGTTRESFSKEIHKKATSSIKSYWQQAVFSGSGTPPPEKKSDNEIINYVKSHSGAIGYISSGTSTDGVKVVSIL